jgi:hypothetical protein
MATKKESKKSLGAPRMLVCGKFRSINRAVLTYAAARVTACGADCGI